MASLDNDIAPLIEDSFISMQIKAISELLSNLAPRVDWSAAEYEQEAHELRELATILADAGLSQVDGENAGRVALLEAVSQGISQTGDTPKSPASEGALVRLEAALLDQASNRTRSLVSTMYRATPAKAAQK